MRTTKTDQTARIHRLIWVFVWRPCQKVRFLTVWLILKLKEEEINNSDILVVEHYKPLLSSTIIKSLLPRGMGCNFIKSYIWNSLDVRAELPPFSALSGIWLVPFFQQKSILPSWFSFICMWKAPFFWHPSICTYFSLRIFSGLLGILWIDWYLSNYQQ